MRKGGMASLFCEAVPSIFYIWVKEKRNHIVLTAIYLFMDLWYNTDIF